MLFTPDPLTERLALVWHNHFATSQLKVDDVDAMRRQNETFRRHAHRPFGDLLRAMLRDPALLYWLDAPSNRKGKPNAYLAGGAGPIDLDVGVADLLAAWSLGPGLPQPTPPRSAGRACPPAVSRRRPLAQSRPVTC
jgi:Protein of unknown function (DUF1800)